MFGSEISLGRFLGVHRAQEGRSPVVVAVHFPHKVTSSSALDINQVALDKQLRFGFRAPACARICAHDRLAALGKRWKSLTFLGQLGHKNPSLGGVGVSNCL
jgi:hypothetical protein